MSSDSASYYNAGEYAGLYRHSCMSRILDIDVPAAMQAYATAWWFRRGLSVLEGATEGDIDPADCLEMGMRCLLLTFARFLSWRDVLIFVWVGFGQAMVGHAMKLRLCASGVKSLKRQ